VILPTRNQSSNGRGQRNFALLGYLAAKGGSARAAATFLRLHNYAENRASFGSGEIRILDL
jgi:hypothetical protein